jgi:hypothetical protein
LTSSPAIIWQQPIATINNTTISMDYFIKVLRFYSLTSRGNISSPTFPYQVLKWIENDELIGQAAPGLGINVNPDEIVTKINDDMIPIAGGGWNSKGNITGSITLLQSDIGKTYQQWLNYVRLSDSEYRYLVEADILRQKIIDYFTQSVPTEAKQVHIYAIKLDNEGSATEVENRLQNGDNFATVAAEFSTDETTKQFGGDLGWLPMGILSFAVGPQLDQVAFSLAAGNVSGIIVSTDGSYYIIKVAEIDNNRPIDKYNREDLASIAFSNWLMEQRKVVEIKEYLDQTTATWAMNQIS